MKALIVGLLVTLAVLHQDFWWWDDRSVLFGFLPIGLAWHAAISVAAGVIGLLAVTFCWPADLDSDVDAAAGTDVGGGTDVGAGARGEGASEA